MSATETEPLARLVGFGRELRRRGLALGTERILTFCRAAAAVDPGRRDDLYWAGRATLVARPEDVPSYDAAFDAWFGATGDVRIDLALPTPGEGLADALAERDALPDSPVEERDVAGTWRGADDADEPEGEASLRIVASAVEVLRTRSFEHLSDEERRRVDRLIRDLEVRAPRRPSRRLRVSDRRERFDLRRTLRGSLRTEGEPFDRAWRARGTRARPLVFLLDVSGSMAPYARALLQFGYAAMATGRRVEVFCFGTRLSRVTRTLRTRDPDRALREIGAEVEDWEGGTRIGASLRTLLDGWSQRAALRGAVVVICSDGLERGDPEYLRAQMVRLRRLAHRIVWVNPLRGDPRYEPLARGMAAALPSIDVFLAGHNLERLEELARVIGD
jgi:uncharacterized protein with von Willebrand factor type A (vWA) domain